MKHIAALVLSLLLLSGITLPVFAADEAPQTKLVAAEILSVPEKNQVVPYGFPGDSRVPPDGIVVKLTFDNGSEITDAIEAINLDGNTVYRVAGLPVYTPRTRPDGWLVIDDPVYGEMTADLYFGEDLIKASYTYLSINPEAPKTPMEQLLICLRFRWRMLLQHLKEAPFYIIFVLKVIFGKIPRGILPEGMLIDL